MENEARKDYLENCLKKGAVAAGAVAVTLSLSGCAVVDTLVENGFLDEGSDPVPEQGGVVVDDPGSVVCLYGPAPAQ